MLIKTAKMEYTPELSDISGVAICMSIILGLFLPIIFILHSIEEYRSFDKFKNIYFGVRLQRRAFLYALIFLTFFISGICISNYFMSNQILQLATTLIAIAFLLNGVQHCAISLWSRKIFPGTLSAMFLLIPYCTVYLIVLEREIQFGIVDIVRWFIISMILMLLSIHISLWIGLVLAKKF